MFTDKRLMGAYNNAHRIPFDKHSKFIFFSDLHRGDDSVSDQFVRNQHIVLHALDYYYNKGYSYIELGDGDELWEYPNFKLIRFAHTDVFIPMKKLYDEGRFFMIYGNHNMEFRNRRYVRENLSKTYDEHNQSQEALFPGIKVYEAIVLKHRKTKQEIFAVHGHQGDLMNDQLWMLSRFLMRYFWRYLHVVGFRNPSSPARNLYKRHKIERKYKTWIRNHKRILICGHTHRPRFPRKGELPYFNTGCCINSKGIIGIEIVNDKILMVDWRVRAKNNGTLQIIRTVVRGPEPIENFDFENNNFYLG